MQEGVDGLLRDKTRPLGIAPLEADVVELVVALTQHDPPGEATHWTASAMAEAAGISVSSVQRIWRGHGLQPHQVRQFKLSTDPAFAAKLRDVIGPYVAPPTHAVVLSVDERSKIQALARTQAPLPMKAGQPTTRTHDYVRHRTTTLFATLNVLEGSVIGSCMQRRRHQEFIRFLKTVEAAVPGRGRCAGRKGRPRHPRQLRRSQTSQEPAPGLIRGPGLARSPPALDLPLHPDFYLLAQRRRGRLRLSRRTPDRHQPLHRRRQPEPETLRLDRRPGSHHPSCKTRVPSARFAPLDENREVRQNRTRSSKSAASNPSDTENSDSLISLNMSPDRHRARTLTSHLISVEKLKPTSKALL